MKTAYAIKLLNFRKKQYEWVCHYDKLNNDLVVVDNWHERQEYLSKESLLEDLNAIINNEAINLNVYQIIIVKI